MNHWLQYADGVVRLMLHVQPGAKKTEFAGMYGDAMKIRLAAPPVEGKANQALCAFLADFCSVPKRNVYLLSGQTSRAKRIAIKEIGADALGRLQSLA